MIQSRVFFAKSLLPKKYIPFLIVSFLAWPITAATALAQDDGPSFTVSASDPSKTDSSLPAANPGIPQTDPANPHANSNSAGVTYDPDFSLKHFPMRVLQDQKELWLFPTQLARGRHWIPTLAIIGVTGGLIAASATILLLTRPPKFSVRRIPALSKRAFPLRYTLPACCGTIPIRKRRRFLPARHISTARSPM